MWLGIRDESGETLIGTQNGVIKVNAIRRKGSNEERWNADEILGIKGVPWEPVPGRGGTTIRATVHIPDIKARVEPTDEGTEKRSSN